ncbi:hypothetical protein RFI_23670, partial [Reticulomyxa filosa]
MNLMKLLLREYSQRDYPQPICGIGSQDNANDNANDNADDNTNDNTNDNINDNTNDNANDNNNNNNNNTNNTNGNDNGNDMSKINKKTTKKRSLKEMEETKEMRPDNDTQNHCHNGDRTNSNGGFHRHSMLALESPMKKRRLSSHLSPQLNNALRSELRNTHHPQVSHLLLQMQRMLDCNIQFAI